MEKKLYKVVMFTDGSCNPNPGHGGWAVLLCCNGVKKELFGDEAKSTSNRMELRAAIEGLSVLKFPCEVEIVTDLKYLCDSVDRIEKWKRSGWLKSNEHKVKNVDLWKALAKAALPHKVTFTWIPGHTGHPENERVDQLAKKARKSSGAAM